MDIDRYRPIFMNFGLAITLFGVLCAFEWRFETESPCILTADQETYVFDFIDIRPTAIPPPVRPLPAIVTSTLMTPVEKVEHHIDDIEVDLPDLKDDLYTEFSTDFAEEPIEIADVHKLTVHDLVSDMPIPEGGNSGFYDFISKNIRYPKKAKQHDVEGRVLVQFIINEYGKLVDPQVVKGIGYGCDTEAIRVLTQSPRWSPGKQNGRSVKVRIILPIFFKLK